MKNGTRAALLRTARRFVRSESGRRGAALAGWFTGGFVLAAASLERSFQPLALGLLCAGRGGWNG
ncbi:MAG: hypothetical protein J6I89_03810, partial [Oscillospiraceae bacterium]|nr:hypothetical protein [Oscillospiraceae bacterium]